MLHNIELEAELLSHLLFDNQLVDKITDHVAATDFSMPHHARIFTAICSEVMQGSTANAITLKSYFDSEDDVKAFGGAKYLAELSGMMPFGGAVDTAKQLARLARRRDMQAGLTEAAQACEDMETSLVSIMDMADGALSEQSRNTIHQPSGADAIAELIADYGSDKRGVKCGQIQEFDDLLGPIRPKQLVILAARPAMGKTAVALSYALGAAQRGHGVLYASLEMSSTDLAGRMVADLCYSQDVDLPYNAIRDGTLNANQRDWINKAHQFAGELPFQIVDTGSLTVSRLGMLVRAHQRRMKASGKALELVVVDYLQLLQADRKTSAYERISEISMGLKALAKDTGVGILALAQLSRSVEQREDKRPLLSDLRDSGQIEQDADAVMFLLRDEYYLRQAEPDPGDAKHIEWQDMMDKVRGQIEFILAKRRNGPTGSAIGAFHGAYQAVRSAN